MRSSWVPPNNIPPMRPLPTGKASTHLLAGRSKVSLKGEPDVCAISVPVSKINPSTVPNFTVRCSDLLIEMWPRRLPSKASRGSLFYAEAGLGMEPSLIDLDRNDGIRVPGFRQFDLDDHINRICCGLGYLDCELVTILAIRNRSAIRVRHAHDARRQSGKLQSSRFRDVQDMQIDSLPLVCGNTIITRKPRTAARAVDAFTVLLQPGTDFAETLDLRRINFAVGTRAHVQNEVSIATGGADQKLNQVRQGLHLRVLLITPAALDNGGAQLKRSPVVELA